MTVAPHTIRRTASLLTVAASLALPGAALAKPVGDTARHHEVAAPVVPTISAPSSTAGDDNTLPIVLASGALAIALGGAAYSFRLGSAQRRTTVKAG